MTMSVGLGKITNDPNASILVRKALGALSTPGLLVHDKGITIDDDGRITLRLNPGGGLSEDENGISVVTTEEFGVDSYVNAGSEATGNRDWNARLTGTAPNFFESGLAIGTEDLGGISSSEFLLEDAMLQVNSKTAQMRLAYDTENFGSSRVLSTGVHEMYSVGTAPGFHLMTGDGTYGDNEGGFRLNNGTVIEQIMAIKVAYNFTGGGSSGAVTFQEAASTYIPVSSAYDIRPGQDMITVCPTVAPPVQLMCWSARISATNQLAIRIGWVNAMLGFNDDWMILIHRIDDETTVT